MIVSIVVAAAENGVIGKGNRMPWRLPDDLRFFKRLTSGHSVIMGRKTYESIGKPLPDRRNIILSKTAREIKGCEVMPDLETALAACASEEVVFIIGGGSVYTHALENHLVQRIYLTKVHHAVEGDTHFHIPDPKDWKVVSVDRHESDEQHAWPFSFIHLDRN
jgi:dihydrofolate reductase